MPRSASCSTGTWHHLLRRPRYSTCEPACGFRSVRCKPATHSDDCLFRIAAALTGGQSRRFGDVCDMFALPPTSAVMTQCRERQKEQGADINRLYSMTSSAVASEPGIVTPQRVRGFNIDDQFEFGRALDRQIGGAGAVKNPGNVKTNPPIKLDQVRAIRHQAAAIRKGSKLRYCGNTTS